MRRGDRYFDGTSSGFFSEPNLDDFYFLERNYVIGCGSSTENFDKDLPVFQTMLRSLNGTDTDAIAVA